MPCLSMPARTPDVRKPMILVHGLFDLNSEARLGGHPRVPRSSAFDARRVTISPRTGIPMRDGRMACCCRQTLTAQQQSTDWQTACHVLVRLVGRLTRVAIEASARTAAEHPLPLASCNNAAVVLHWIRALWTVIVRRRPPSDEASPGWDRTGRESGCMAAGGNSGSRGSLQ